MKIGITGSLSSGKSSVAKMLSKNNNILFSADKIVQDLYKKKSFKIFLSRKLNIPTHMLRKEIKVRLLKKKLSLKTLGRIIHPIVRKKMRIFYKKNVKRKILFFEIPLLVESKLINFFDYIILVAAPKKERLRRYLKKGGDKKMFKLLDSSQIPVTKKVKYCDYLIVNNKSKNFLKQKVNDIIHYDD